MKQEIIKLTEKLVTFESTSDNLIERKKVINFLVSFIKSKTKEVIIVKTKKTCGFSNQVITSIHVFNPKLRRKKSILLLGHVDVVPGDTFVPKNNAKFIFGRGTGDMKSSVVIATFLFLKHHKERNIQLVITSDEEIGGHAGAGVISKKIKPDFVIALEPTNLDLRIVEKGALQIEIEVKTAGGHSAKPWQNLSAIDIMLNVISELKKIFKNPQREQWTNTLNIGAILGGNIKKDCTLGSSNIIANNCKIKLDLRLIESCSHNEAIDVINTCINKVKKDIVIKNKFCNLENEFFEINAKNPDVVVEHLVTDKKNTFVQELVKSIQKIKGNCKITKAPAASDARFFSSLGIPSVVFGAKSINHHGINEHVEISSLMDVFRILDDFIEKY